MSIKNIYFDRFILSTKTINNVNWDKAMHICFCVDEKYIKYAGVMLLSIVENNLEQSIVFHLFCDKINQEDIENLNICTQKYLSISIVVYLINEKDISDFPQTDGVWNLSIYYRAIAPQVLYGKVKKLLYLDVDMCCVGNIKDLFIIPLDNNIAAVVEDAMGNHTLEKKLRKLGCCENKKYFNSGMMLFNVEKYYKDDILNKFIDVIKKHTDKLYFWDQDAFNIVIGKVVKYINCQYNYQKINKKHVDIRIVHFTGVRKPWFCNFDYYFFDIWRKVYNSSPWGNINLDNKKNITYTEYRYQANYYKSKHKYLLALKNLCLYIKEKFKVYKREQK